MPKGTVTVNRGDTFKHFGRTLVEYTPENEIRVVGRKIRARDAGAVVEGMLTLVARHEPGVAALLIVEVLTCLAKLKLVSADKVADLTGPRLMQSPPNPSASNSDSSSAGEASLPATTIASKVSGSTATKTGK